MDLQPQLLTGLATQLLTRLATQLLIGLATEQPTGGGVGEGTSLRNKESKEQDPAYKNRLAESETKLTWS